MCVSFAFNCYVYFWLQYFMIALLAFWKTCWDTWIEDESDCWWDDKEAYEGHGKHFFIPCWVMKKIAFF